VHDCLAVCDASKWPKGELTDTDVNSLGCRQNHAIQAQALTDAGTLELEQICEVAGQSSGNQCGSWCLNYCQMFDDVCGEAASTANVPYSYSEDDGGTSCMAACVTIDDMAEHPTNYGHGKVNFFYYDTIQCRIAHMVSAARHEAEDLHCPHSSFESATGACVDDSTPNCSHYCDMVDVYCSDDGGIPDYEDFSDCQSKCSDQWFKDGGTGVIGNHGDFSGDTLGCRINHAEYARNCSSADFENL
jgi:hypothetical protein